MLGFKNLNWYFQITIKYQISNFDNIPLEDFNTVSYMNPI